MTQSLFFTKQRIIIKVMIVRYWVLLGRHFGLRSVVIFPGPTTLGQTAGRRVRRPCARARRASNYLSRWLGAAERGQQPLLEELAQ